jgi:hypothetical protein
MREPVAREASGSDAIGEAARRLDRALTRLEKSLAARGEGGGSDLFERDRSALAAELDSARARERALEEAAAAASEALGRAAAEVRLALGEDEGEDDGLPLEAEALEDEAGWEASQRDLLEDTGSKHAGSKPGPKDTGPKDTGDTAGADPSGKAAKATRADRTAADAEPARTEPHKDPAS